MHVHCITNIEDMQQQQQQQPIIIYADPVVDAHDEYGVIDEHWCMWIQYPNDTDIFIIDNQVLPVSMPLTLQGLYDYARKIVNELPLEDGIVISYYFNGSFCPKPDY